MGAEVPGRLDVGDGATVGDGLGDAAPGDGLGLDRLVGVGVAPLRGVRVRSGGVGLGEDEEPVAGELETAGTDIGRTSR